MYITSSDFLDGQTLSDRFTCDGEGYNPELHIHEVPEAAVTLALIMEDPDAPSGSFTHWLLWNIPADSHEITTGSKSEGAVQGMNGSGTYGYYPPCPPAGDPPHHYHFKAYALSKKIDASSSVSKSELKEYLEPHILAKAELIGKYGR